MATITRAEASKMLADAFEAPLDSIKPEVARDDIAGWDSMGALSLMAELDERFNITLSAEESKKMRSIADVFTLLSRNGVLAD